MLIVLSGLCTSMVLGMPAAYAHAEIEATSPVDEAVLGAAPHQVELRFSEGVILPQRSIQLLDADGHPVGIGAPAHPAGRGELVTATLPPVLPQGTYVVAWRVVSDDAHVVSGAFEFSVGAPSPSVTLVGRHPSRVAPALNATGQAVAFVGMAVTIGGAVLIGALWPGGSAPRRGRCAVWVGLFGLGAGTLVVLLVQYPYSTGGAFTSAFSATALRTTLSSRIGEALAARLVITAALAAMFALVMRTRPRPLPRLLIGAWAACAIALTATWTLADHSHTGMQAGLAVPVACVHLLAVSLWLGGLVTLAVCVTAAAADDQRDQALARFSRLALPSFAAIVLTGLYQSWREVGTLGALPATEFGRLLLIKLGGVLVILTVASQARRFVRRVAIPRGVSGLVAVEATFGVAVLAVTTLLVNAAPARGSYAPPVHAKVRVPATAQPATRLDGGHVEIRLSPAKHGVNVADVYLVARDGTLVTAAGVTAQLAPGSGEGAQPVAISPAEPGHYVASQVSIPYAGKWVLRLSVRTSGSGDVPVQIRFRAH
jgi:copper transport protein